MDRKTLLAVLTFAQGLLTLIMAFSLGNLWVMIILRAFNGACLAGMMPLVFSIIADRFDDEVRGRFFALMNMAKGLGEATTLFLYGLTAEWCAAEGRFESCETNDPCNSSCSCDGLFGWQYSFIITGGVTMAFAPFIYILMKPPPVTVREAPTSGENVFVSELKGLGKLLYSTPTFLVLVTQGCFGAIPGNAMSLRSFFFQSAGLSLVQATTIQSTASYVNVFGTGFSGWLSDSLVRTWPLHGRIINAEFSVYSGIPLCFFSFFSTFAPSAEIAFVYFFTLAFLLSLVQGGVAGGTNAPILSQLAEPEDRALIIAWQNAMEGSVSCFGPVIFAVLNYIFGYNRACENACNPPAECESGQNGIAAGNALLFCTVVPWGICGALYSSLHYFYPRDMERIFEQRRLKEGLGVELTSS